LHGYDLDRITDGLIIRRSNAGEKLETLDGQVRVLHPEDLLITDGSGPIGLAGVMGGASTEITDATINVLIEAASFDQVSIARTARRHKLPSEASKRFERGVDPLVAAPAAARAAELLVELAGGTIDELGSTLTSFTVGPLLTLDPSFPARLIGVDYTAAEVRGTLELIGASVVDGPNGLQVTPPSWRPDLTDAASLVEEIARITGYDRIPSELPVAPPGRGLTREQRLRRAAGQGLASAGLTEVLTYPFIALRLVETFTPGQPAVKLANPLDPASAWMRTTLLPGLLETAHRNLSRGLTDLALFEIGHVYLPAAGVDYGSGPLPVGNALPSDAELADLDSSIPPQPWHAGAIFVGDAIPKQPGTDAAASGISDALAAAHQLALSVGGVLRIERGNHAAMHPGRTAQLLVGDTVIGHAGELLPAIALEANLPRVVGVLELDLDRLLAAAPEQVVPSAISGFNATTQDLSLVVPNHVAAAVVLQALVAGAGTLLENVSLVDDYRGAGVPEGSKSLTFALRFRASDRTLTADEATAAKLAGLAVATERTGATLRE
jgi:phenylalanyl-tRNA synthetase beta chain